MIKGAGFVPSDKLNWFKVAGRDHEWLASVGPNRAYSIKRCGPNNSRYVLREHYYDNARAPVEISIMPHYTDLMVEAERREEKEQKMAEPSLISETEQKLLHGTFNMAHDLAERLQALAKRGIMVNLNMAEGKVVKFDVVKQTKIETAYLAEPGSGQ